VDIITKKHTIDMVQQIYESDPRLRVGDVIQSYVNGNLESVEL
jgi:hypothetical protein